MGRKQQISFWVVMVAVFFSATALEAAPYLNGTVKLNGVAYTKEASVYLNCQGSNYSYCSDNDQISSSGQYSLEGTSEWNCCSSTNASRTWSSCQIYAYQWNDQTVASGRYVDVSLDCDTTLTQDLALTPKDKTIEVTLKVGEETLASGMNVSCSETSAPWASSYITSPTNGVWRVPVTAGTFRCYAYCDWATWQGACPYGGNPEKTIIVNESDTTVSTTLNFSVKDKTIQVSVYQGDNLITDRVSVSCNQQSPPYTWGSDTTASSEGTYDILVTEGRYYCYSYCNSWPCEDFSGSPNTYVDVGPSDSVVPATLRYQLRDKKIRTTLVVGSRQITSGMSVYCSQQGGSWDYSNATYEGGVYTCNVGTGSYRVYAYCTDYNQCAVSGNPSATVDFTSSDPTGTTADVTLVFLENDATLSGLVTDGSSGVGNVWVNANANSISGGSHGGIASLTYKGVTVSGGSADAAQVYRSAQTDSSGAFTMTLPAGTYQVSVYPPYDRSDLAQTSQEVTVATGGTSTVVLTMQRKTASITACLRDANGNAVRGYINGWSHNGTTGGGDYIWGQVSTSDACADFGAVEGYTYNLSASCDTWSSNDTTLCNYTSEGMQSVTATRDGTTVDFTCPICDCSMTVNLVDPDGEIVPINASIDCTPKSFSTGESYHGIWGWSSSGTGVLDVASGVEYLCNAWIWSEDHTSSNEASCSCSDGSSSCEITLASVIEDCVSGSFLDDQEAAVDTSGGNYFYVYATQGRSYKNCDITATGYSCDLSEGTWNLCYSTQTSSGYACASQGASCQDVICAVG
ncbi:MAG: carboxypeptidase regulatory-like domain-containing protein, partial [Deltaproteobacteria bacterium]|nr:carboxypeptidase regulatory-like domain-containing protein [Deltaproteobacteria bacterium]